MTDAVADAPLDADLMARVAAGDHEAFAALYDRHVRAVYGAVLRYLRDPAAAEEVVQETYLAIWQRPDRYAADKGSLVGWLLSIARNRAIDRLRAASRRPLLIGLDPGPSDREEGNPERLMALGRPVGSGATADEPSDVAERRWVQAVVRTALDGMSEPERQVLLLAYDDGLTQPEIAERLGWPLGTVKTRTRRAMLRLRAMLESIPDIGPWAAPSPAAAWGEPDGARHGPR
jgi:RNA polymerase sigma-70 factor (ECF subfamily)